MQLQEDKNSAVGQSPQNCVPSQLVFSSDTSLAKSDILIKGYIEMKINKHDI